MNVVADSIRKNIWLIVLCTAMSLLSLEQLAAQGYFGTVSGNITDPSQANVPGISVTLSNQGKGYTQTTTADKNGRYLFTAIPPGVYSVSAEAPGFERIVRTNITVNVSENSTADLQLSVASSKQSVDVQSQGQALATEDAVTGSVINRRFINDLPLIDRNVLNLVGLSAGVNNQSESNPITDTGTNFVSNGSRGASADILLDGSTITNFEPNGGVTQITYTPSAEAVDEFKVQQSNFSAEYGFSGGSVVNMVTRSGSNAFHGSGYDYLRNKITDANNWFNNANGVPLAPVHRNNYGGTIGGPIIKDKTFFFFDYDGTRSSDLGVYQAGVPSAAERNGDFGELCAANGGTFDSTGLCSAIAGQIYDPYSGTFQTPDDGPAGSYRSAFIPFNNMATYTSPGNANLNGTRFALPQVPGNLIDPVAQKMMNLFPSPNIAGGSIYDNWIASGGTPSKNDQFDIRIDHRFSDKNLITFKYSQNWNSRSPFKCFGNFTDPCGSGQNSGTAHLFAINDTHSFTPTLVLTSTFGFTRGTTTIDAYDSKQNADPLGTLGFPSYLNANGFLGVPAMFIGGGYFAAGSDGTSIGQDPYNNYRQGQDSGQLTELLSKVAGKHELKFGFEGRLHQQNYIQSNTPNGQFGFSNSGSAQCPVQDITVCGGDAMASFAMGQLANGGSAIYQIQFRPATQNFQYAGYVQDNWKVHPKLTLNLGLRWDVSLPRTERRNRTNWFDPSVQSPLNGGTLDYVDPLTGQDTSRSLLGGELFNNSSLRTNWRTDWKDIQPRFGFSYLWGKSTVLRGGYGIYYSQNRSGANGLLSYGSQGFTQTTDAVTTFNNDGATPYLHLDNPFANGLIQPPGSSLGLLNDVGYGAVGPLRTVAAARTPYEQSWTLGIQRELGGNTVLDLEYVGKKGNRLYFAGQNNLNVLGRQIESLTPTQIGDLGNYVDNPFAPLLTDPYYSNSPLSSPTVQAYQLLLPYPQFTNVTTDEPPTANSIYHSLQVSVEKRYSNGLQLLANFTWSKSIDNSSIYDNNVSWLANGVNSGNPVIQDPNNPAAERSLSTFDVPYSFKFNYTYDLPFGRGRKFFGGMPRALDLVVGGWRTAGVWTVQTGFPLQFVMENGGTPIFTYGNQRPNLTGTPKKAGGPESNWINNYFADPDVFQAPDPYTLGNAPRAIGSVRSPFLFTTNLSILKDFALSPKNENLRLELRLEAQNALNHPIFNSPNTVVGDPDFGLITGTSVSPRECQLALKFYF